MLGDAALVLPLWIQPEIAAEHRITRIRLNARHFRKNVSGQTWVNEDGVRRPVQMQIDRMAIRLAPFLNGLGLMLAQVRMSSQNAASALSLTLA
jgi:hypothetical protein